MKVQCYQCNEVLETLDFPTPSANIPLQPIPRSVRWTPGQSTSTVSCIEKTSRTDVFVSSAPNGHCAPELNPNCRCTWEIKELLRKLCKLLQQPQRAISLCNKAPFTYSSTSWLTNLPKRQPQQSLISTALNSSCKTNTLFRPGFGSSCQELPKTRRQVWQELCHRSQLYLKSFPFQRPPAGTAAGQSTSPDRPSSALLLFRRKSLQVRKGRTNTSWKLRTVFVLHYLFFFPLWFQ